MHSSKPQPDRYVTKSEVLSRVPYSHTQLWRMVRDGTFPAPRRLGPRRVAWLESELTRWMEGRETVLYAPEEEGLVQPTDTREG